MNKNLISIIMPVYNCENYIGQAIESIKRQSYKDWELIIVNDGSTDNTLKKIELKTHNIKEKVKLINIK